MCLPEATVPGQQRRHTRWAALSPCGDIDQVLLACRGLYNVALIGRILLTWFPQAPEPLVRPLATVVDPYLNLFRGEFPSYLLDKVHSPPSLMT